MALVACGSSNNPNQQSDVSSQTGFGGAVVGAGGAPPAPTATPIPTGTTTVPTPGAGGTVALPPPGTGGAAVVLPPPGAGGATIFPPPAGGGGTTSTTTPGAGGAPAGGAPSGGAAGSGGATVTADPPGTVSVSTIPFQVNPGQETYKCQNFDNPFGGKDVALNRIVTDMSVGSHHLHVYNLTEGTGRGLEDCTSADFHALVHAAGSPHAETDYPAGMATKIKGSTGLRIQLHYINTGSDPITATSTLKMTPVADISTVNLWVAELYFNRVNLVVPPGTPSISTTCSIPASYGMITLVGGGTHMHSRGIKEVAVSSTGAQLADVDTWNEPPPIAYNPYIPLNPGDTITWTCTYNNNTGMTLTFGESAATNEMCIYLARYYSTNANDTQIACQAVADQGGMGAPQPY